MSRGKKEPLAGQRASQKQGLIRIRRFLRELRALADTGGTQEAVTPKEGALASS